MSNVIYMSAFKNGFGPEQSYHAFLDTLIRICEELENESDQILTNYPIPNRNISEVENYAIVDEILRKVKRINIQQVDTYEFLHRTMMADNNSKHSTR